MIASYSVSGKDFESLNFMLTYNLLFIVKLQQSKMVRLLASSCYIIKTIKKVFSINLLSPILTFF